MTRQDFLKKAGLGLAAVGIYGNAPGQPGTVEKYKKMITQENSYEIVVVGGSYSGLSAAMALGRSLRKTLIIDSGLPCNRQTPHSHNFITHDGRKPADIAHDAKQQVLAYPTVKAISDRVVEVTGEDHNFTIQAATGNSYNAKKLLFATGVKDIMPAIDGFAACWGITILHCPYCHGYEVRGKNTGILVNDESAMEFAKLIRHWTDQVTVFTNGEAKFNKDELKDLGVPIEEKAIANIKQANGFISAIQFTDGSTISLDALYHRPAFEQHCEIPVTIGCEMTETGHIKVNESQQTTLPGIYASGDCTTRMRAVSVSVAQGSVAGSMLNHELISGS